MIGGLVEKRKKNMSVDISNGSLDQQIAKLMTCQVIKESEVKNLCTKYKEILSKYPNVQTLSSPVTVSKKKNLKTKKKNKNRFVETFMDNFMI